MSTRVEPYRSAVLTTANQLTILRIVFVPVFIILLAYREVGWALCTFVFAGITDVLDGLIARRMGQKTSIGETYDMYAMTAAHKNLPLPTYARVTNLENGRSVIVKVNDRGPFAKNRIIDLSYTAATRLGIIAKGTGFVEIRALDPRHPQTPLPAGQAPGQHANVYLQVGSYPTRDKAEQMLDRVNRALPVGAHITEGIATQRTYYRVRIGPISSVAEADKIAAILTESGIEAPRLVAD